MSFDRDSVSTAVPSYMYNMYRMSDTISTSNTIVHELETAGALSTVLKQVISKETVGDFSVQLSARVKEQGKMIEDICHRSYGPLRSALAATKRVSARAHELKTQVETHDKLRSSADKVEVALMNVLKIRRQQQNAVTVLEQLQLCLPALRSYLKLNQQMQECKYYPALKTLEQLEHTYLPRIDELRFAGCMKSKIPLLRDKIKQQSKAELTDFLAEARKQSSKIGHVTMYQAAQRFGVGMSLAADVQGTSGPMDDMSDITDQSDALALLDFSKLYRCYHIYSILNSRSEFVTYYQRQREKQCRLLISQPSGRLDLKAIRNYFAAIVGFFVVEDHISLTAEELTQRGEIEKLWVGQSLQKIQLTLKTAIDQCDKLPEIMLELKTLTVLFCHTMSSYGLDVKPVNDLILEVRDRYYQLLMNACSRNFTQIFKEDNYSPISVDTLELYQEVTSVFQYFEATLESAPFPRIFPFSKMVPEIYAVVKDFIVNCRDFNKDLNMSQSDLDDTVRKCAGALLNRTLDGCLKTVIGSSQVSLSMLIQLSVNMNHLEASCYRLDQYIITVVGLSSRTKYQTARLVGTVMFKEARQQSEQQIYVLLRNKIDEFFELGDYDWMAQIPSGRPSDHITDIKNFLLSTFEAFRSSLPAAIAESAVYQSCQHLNNRMKESLLDPSVRAVSYGSLQQLALDLVECEQFAQNCPIETQGVQIELVFAELKQLISVALDRNWSDFAHVQTLFHQGKSHDNKYLRVSLEDARLLGEKVLAGMKKPGAMFRKQTEEERVIAVAVSTCEKLQNSKRQVSS